MFQNNMYTYNQAYWNIETVYTGIDIVSIDDVWLKTWLHWSGPPQNIIYYQRHGNL